MMILIGKCLRVEPEKRISVNDMLKYPLIANHDKGVFRFIQTPVLTIEEQY